MLYPLKLQAAFKDYLWGGTRLRDEFNKQTDINPVAESWELSCHHDGQSIIENGIYAGKTLNNFIETEGTSVIGTKSKDKKNFPILIKFIDAKQSLSVQVHPDDNYALLNEGESGKTEMWYVMDAEPNSTLIYGFTKEISHQEFEKRIHDNTLLEVCNQVPIKKEMFSLLKPVPFMQSAPVHLLPKFSKAPIPLTESMITVASVKTANRVSFTSKKLLP